MRKHTLAIGPPIGPPIGLPIGPPPLDPPFAIIRNRRQKYG
jgi:hypothetical protein